MKSKYSRRQFLRGVSCCAAGVGMSHGLFAQIARACTPSAKHVVLIYESGGKDSLDWLMNTDNSTLETIRPTLYPHYNGSNRLALGSTGWALNSRLTNLKNLYDAGRVAFLPFAGYQNFTGSHDEARNQYMRGLPVRSGMMNTDGIFIKVAKAHPSTFTSRNCIFSVSGNDRATEPQSLAINLDDLSGLGLGGVLDAESAHPANSGFAALAHIAAQNSQQDDIVDALNAVKDDVDELQAIAQSKPNYGLNGNGLARDLEEIEALIRNLPNRSSFLFCEYGGHDTHGSQRNANNTLQTRFDDAVNAFLNSTADIADNILVYTMSDFGRTNRENAGAGTDHAGSGLITVIGSQNNINGGIYESPPTSNELLASSNSLPMKINHANIQAEIQKEFLGLSNVAAAYPGFTLSNIGFIK